VNPAHKLHNHHRAAMSNSSESPSAAVGSTPAASEETGMPAPDLLSASNHFLFYDHHRMDSFKGRVN